MMRCPYCAEDITDDDATRCPHCGSRVPTAGEGSPRRVPAAAPPAGGWEGQAGGWGISAAGPAEMSGSEAGASAAPPGAAAPPTGSVQFSHTGQRYLLGYDTTDFGIWDRSAPASPVERYPRTDEGWSRAWTRYASLEPHNQPVHAGPPPGATYGPPGPGSGPVAPPWQTGQPVYYVPQPQRTNGLAVAALVLGIVGVILAPLAIPEILGLIFGLVALNQIRNAAGVLAGRGLAIAGIVLGSVGCAIFVIWLIAVTTDSANRF